MPSCPKCKVNLAPDARHCPLCKSPVAAENAATGQPAGAARAEDASRAEGAPRDHDAARTRSAPFSTPAWADEARDASREGDLSPKQKRVLAFELLAASLGFTLVVTLALDFMLFRRLTWSRYSGIVLVELFLASGMPLVLWKRFWLVFSVLAPSLLAGLFLWGVFSGDLSWVLVPALPIALATEGLAAGGITLARLPRRKGLNVIGIALAAGALLAACVDASLAFADGGRIGLSWSVFVLASALPLSGFFFYVHYRLLSRASLGKLFRA